MIRARRLASLRIADKRFALLRLGRGTRAFAVANGRMRFDTIFAALLAARVVSADETLAAVRYDAVTNGFQARVICTRTCTRWTGPVGTARNGYTGSFCHIGIARLALP